MIVTKHCCLLYFFLFLLFGSAFAQGNFVQSHEYPKGVFRYPLDLPPSTAGSFGELRANHFHAGLDFRTNQRTGYPVHAALDGYVSRLKIQYGGFGNAVYITHPNGFTTVYGHLDHFSPEITGLVKKEQERLQRFEVDFGPDPLKLPVSKGQVFAWSGNTGASGGPHLHFEIRDTKTQETINAQLFGLTIPDRVPPTITSVSVYHLNGHPFNENTLHQTYPVRGTAGNYHLLKPQTLELSGSIGFGIAATDMNSTSANRNGVYSIELKVDGKTVYTYAVERFAFDQTHAINAYIDYPHFIRTGSFIQKCFILPGSRITLYPQSINRGVVTFNDDSLHEVEYVVKDIAGNTSTVKLKVRSSIPKESRPVVKTEGMVLRYNQRTEFTAPNIRIIAEPYNLYDDLDLIYSTSPRRPGGYSEVHHIQNRFTPIHDSLNVWVKPEISLGKYADKAVLYSTTTSGQESEYADGYVKAKIHAFGDFYIRIDTVPPSITPLTIHNGSNLAARKTISFRISDNLSGVKSYVGKIDGKWVLVEHDYKSKIFIYTFGPDITHGKHTFELTATDYKNNVSQFTADFFR
jgi:murein DD-endopeptidase MepM/ murein hydrolase activator NlpD